MADESESRRADAQERLAANVEQMRRASLRLRQGAQRMVGLPALCREVASGLDRLAYETEQVMDARGKEAADGSGKG